MIRHKKDGAKIHPCAMSVQRATVRLGGDRTGWEVRFAMSPSQGLSSRHLAKQTRLRRYRP